MYYAISLPSLQVIDYKYGLQDPTCCAKTTFDYVDSVTTDTVLISGIITLVCTSLLVHEFLVASFPGRSHLQYLIAYSMQIRRGKAWEIWSCAVT